MEKLKYEDALMEVVKFRSEDVMDEFTDSRDNTSGDPGDDKFGDEEAWK